MVMRKSARIILETGTVHFDFLRSGTAGEIRSFLQCIESAYKKTLFVELFMLRVDDYIEFYRRFFGMPRRYEYPFAAKYIFSEFDDICSSQDIYNQYPESILEIKRIEISSPGFFEFLGSLNPLEFIRKFLNDRHRRLMDIELLPLEKEKKKIEIELLKSQLMKDKMEFAEKMFELSREYGVPFDDIERRIIGHISDDYHELGKYQDSKLIK